MNKTKIIIGPAGSGKSTMVKELTVGKTVKTLYGDEGLGGFYPETLPDFIVFEEVDFSLSRRVDIIDFWAKTPEHRYATGKGEIGSFKTPQIIVVSQRPIQTLPEVFFKDYYDIIQLTKAAY